MSPQLTEQVKVISMQNITTSYYTYSNKSCEASEIEQQQNEIGASYADAIYLYANALQNNSYAQGDPQEFTNFMKTQSLSYKINNMERQVLMNKNGDQTVYLQLFCIKSDKWSPCLNTQLSLKSDGTIDQYLGREYQNDLHKAELQIWPGGIPTNRPKCDFDRAKCLGDTDMALWEFSVILVASLCIIVFFFGVFVGKW